MANNILQAVCNEVADYPESLKQLNTYIKPGGYISVLEPLGESFSMIGKIKFKMFPLVYSNVLKSFQDVGFQIVKTFKGSFKNDKKQYVDSNEWHLTLAKKL